MANVVRTEPCMQIGFVLKGLCAGSPGCMQLDGHEGQCDKEFREGKRQCKQTARATASAEQKSLRLCSTPLSVSGLRCHKPQCSGPNVQTGAGAVSVQQAVDGSIQTPGQTATEAAVNCPRGALGLQCSTNPLAASAPGETAPDLQTK